MSMASSQAHLVLLLTFIGSTRHRTRHDEARPVTRLDAPQPPLGSPPHLATMVREAAGMGLLHQDSWI